MTAPRGSGPLARWRRSTAGATAVEMAIVFPVFLAMMFGIIELGRMFWVRSSLQHAVEQTARMAMAEYTRESFTSADFSTWFSTWGTSLEGEAPDEVFGWDPSDVTFSATTSTSGGIDYVTIDASYDFDFLFPIIPGHSTETLTASSKTPLIGK